MLRLREAGGRIPKQEGRLRLLSSAVLFLGLLDQPAQLRLWQLLQQAGSPPRPRAPATSPDLTAQLLPQAGAVEAVHTLHLAEPEAPPIATDRLLAEFGPQQKHAGFGRTLGRAAAGFLQAMRDYERTAQRNHPLLTEEARGGPPPFEPTEDF